MLRPSTAHTSGGAAEHPVERVHVGAVVQQYAHRVHVAAHRRAVERRDVVLVLRLGIEPARQHRLEDRGVAAFGRTMKHEVVLGPELGAQAGVSREDRVGRRDDPRARTRR